MKILSKSLNTELLLDPELTLPDATREFVVCNDTFQQGIHYVSLQDDTIIAYASRQLKPYKRNYLTHDLELLLWYLH